MGAWILVSRPPSGSIGEGFSFTGGSKNGNKQKSLQIQRSDFWDDTCKEFQHASFSSSPEYLKFGGALYF